MRAKAPFQFLLAGLLSGVLATGSWLYWTEHPIVVSNLTTFLVGIAAPRGSRCPQAAGYCSMHGSFLDLHPAGATSSSIHALLGGVQGGSAAFNSSGHATLWFGSPESFMDPCSSLSIRDSQGWATPQSKIENQKSKILSGHLLVPNFAP